jgi:hypothetical protein
VHQLVHLRDGHLRGLLARARAPRVPETVLEVVWREGAEDRHPLETRNGDHLLQHRLHRHLVAAEEPELLETTTIVAAVAVVTADDSAATPVHRGLEEPLAGGDDERVGTRNRLRPRAEHVHVELRHGGVGARELKGGLPDEVRRPIDREHKGVGREQPVVDLVVLRMVCVCRLLHLSYNAKRLGSSLFRKEKGRKERKTTSDVATGMHYGGVASFWSWVESILHF